MKHRRIGNKIGPGKTIGRASMSRATFDRSPTTPPAIGRSRRHGWLAAALLSAALLAGPSVADAQLPRNVKQSPNEAANNDQIRAFVDEQLSNFRSGNPTAVSEAREALLGELTGASDEFRRAYVVTFANAVPPYLKGDDVLMKVNAGIVTARFSNAADGGELGDAALAMLQDGNRVMALYGMEASERILLTTLAVPFQRDQDKLVPAIVAAATEQYPEDAMVTQQAYEALSLNLGSGGSVGLNAAGLKSAVPWAVGGMLDVFENRLDLYRQGLPENIQLERSVVSVLTDRNVFLNLRDTEQEERVMQLMADMLRLLARQRANPENNARAAKINDAVEFVARGMAATDIQRFRDAGQQAANNINSAMPASRLQEEVETFMAVIAEKYPDLQPLADPPATEGAMESEGESGTDAATE